MSVVRINAITVDDGSGDELLRRFEQRVGEVEQMAGFESFELLRPTSGNTWYVYTRWTTEEDFEAWVQSQAFARGHAEARRKPVSQNAEVLSFDVVLAAAGSSGAG